MDIAAERQHKHYRVMEILDANNLDGVLLSRRCNFSWYTCGVARNYVGTNDDVGNSTLLVTREGAAVLTTNIEATRLAGEDLAGSGIEVLSYFYADGAERARVFEKAIAGRRMAADVPVAGVAAAPLPAAFNLLRWTLTAGEVERYRAACNDTVAAIEAVMHRAEQGQTENDLAAMAAQELRRRGLLPWVLLAAGDERLLKHRHPLPTANKVRHGFMLVTCAERGGLIAACSRLAHFGKISPELEAKHRAVCTVDTALMAATRPGVKFGAIFAEAQAAYAAVGHPDEWRLHHQGGSIGYLPREVKAAPGEATAAMDCQAFAWNPSITGTKSEDTSLCLGAGPQLLASPTAWPTVKAEWKGLKMDRPAILER